MKRLIIFLFIGGFLLCVFFVCRGFIKSKQEKEKFIKYAISKQDFEILSDLGYCDETGRKDEKRVPFRDKILQNAYLENQDITYLEYSKYLKNISNPLDIRKIDYKTKPVFAIVFGCCADIKEINNLLRLDMNDFIELEKH